MTNEEPIYTIPPFRIESPVLSRAQMSDRLGWGQTEQGLREVWERSRGTGIRVGVIDTGTPDHPDLPEPAFRFNATTDRTDTDHQGHATHVAGILGARANGQGVVGVAPDCQVGYVKGLNDRGVGRQGWLSKAIDICREEGCQIINMSWGGGYSQEIEDAIGRAIDQGCLCVAAIGNSGRAGTIHPGNSYRTAGVASYNQAGKLSRFSSVGEDVDVAAPGEAIYSTWLDGRYQALSGTSMAAPFFAGALALRLAAGSKMVQADIRRELPGWTVDRGPDGFDDGWGIGSINVAKMVPELEPEPVTESAELGPYRIEWTEGQGLTVRYA